MNKKNPIHDYFLRSMAINKKVVKSSKIDSDGDVIMKNENNIEYHDDGDVIMKNESNRYNLRERKNKITNYLDDDKLFFIFN